MTREKTTENPSKVLVAMSGGVDSSVIAALLMEEGRELVGVTMRVVPEMPKKSVFEPCCSVEGAKDARAVAERLGFPHYTVNYLDEFEDEVVGNFVSEYRQGRTPNPCVRCNLYLKFGILLDKARELGADRVATGHYVRLQRRGGRYAIQRAVYRPKDQSYVLAGLSQEQLARALFPLGELTKEQTRERARALGLKTADKAESQEICFIPDNDYRGFLERRVGPSRPGPILNAQGETLGEHTGLANYTVGQRKGLGLTAPRPLYVLRLDVEGNALVVGYEEKTCSPSLVATGIVWGALPAQSAPFACKAQIRYLHEAVAAMAIPCGDTLEVRFETPQRSVTPGQWVVLYDEEDCVISAGLIGPLPNW